ncbi:cobalamin-binding protein [Thalassobaculum fulvum]|uniref:Cobalamin-binding protein n=1 Tax=Thalassobaculum fulvum TaxID=1633335 RepID=A0A919CQT9_9PROT|nr:ABC transporter substrate-binding protein [Thalassobaculum fulvum]GHD56753.1 cobalamin-binding protein [Thalassobaculum fulvum]
MTEHAPRIVSLLPSATEIVAALGLAGRLVGRSHECDFPPEAEAAPVLTRARVDPAKPSRAIHRDVAKLIGKALSVFEVDAERLRAVRPDIILTQHQCEACAVTEQDLAAALAEWTGTAPTVVSLAPATLTEVWNSFAMVGDALDLGWAGRELSEHARERVGIISERLSGERERPRVACVEWLDPPMIAGNWVPDLVTAAGGRPVLADSGDHAVPTTLAKIAGSGADAMVLMPCGFDLPRTMAEGRVFVERPTLAKTRAVREGRVWAVDGNAYFNRPGPRLVSSVEILAEILHPDLFNAGYRGSAWEPLAAEA